MGKWMTAILLVALAGCFSLEGQWTLQGTNNNDPVILQIQDFIFRDQNILQKLTFKGCQQMLLQSQFSQNQVFVNPSSYQAQPIPGKSCNNIDNNPLDSIFESLSKVFYFQININQLLFNDPYGATVLRFNRVIQTPKVDLTGIWTMSQYGNTKTSISVEMSQNEVRFCQGMAVYRYSFPPGRNTIEVKKIKNSCPSKELTAAVQSVRYYRLNDGVLDLYDQDVFLAVQMVFSKAYDPQQPTFSPIVAPTAPPTSTRPTPTSGPAPGSTALVGDWSIITLFDIPFPNSPYRLSFTADKISLLGGCNTFTFPYTLQTISQVITVGAPVSTKKLCTNSDDQLYVSGVQKMHKYLISPAANGDRINFYDVTGNIGYALTNQKATTVTSTPQSKPLPFASGTVLMLLLKRRDLPRAVAKLTGTTLTYTLCNTMTHTFTTADPNADQGNISFKLTSETQKACPVSNDQQYKDALNSVVSYTHDPKAKTVIFKDQSGTQVVTFNRT